MLSSQITSTLLGISIAATILWLLRRDKLHTRHALWWITVAMAVLLLGIFPQLVDWMASLGGIRYPPILAVIIAFAVVFVKLLQLDLELAHHQRMERRLIQRIALMQREIDELKERLANGGEKDGEAIGEAYGSSPIKGGPSGGQTPPGRPRSAPVSSPTVPSPQGDRPAG